MSQTYYTFIILNLMDTETSLAAQWLRFCLPIQGVGVKSLAGEQRSHRPHDQNIKQKQECNKFNKGFKKSIVVVVFVVLVVFLQVDGHKCSRLFSL